MKKVTDENIRWVKLEKPECIRGIAEAKENYNGLTPLVKRIDASKVSEAGKTHIRVYRRK